ncbi:MAG: hypothetical protein ACOZEN_10110 [Thermodesulfobacteriota bacterium]
MEEQLSKKLAEYITPEIIELLGNDACLAIDDMLKDHCTDEKIIDLINRQIEKHSGKVEAPFYQDILDAIRKTSKYQAGINMLRKSIPRHFPPGIARNNCLEHVGLHGYALLDDDEIRKRIIKQRDVGQIAKALLVKDYIKATYGVTLSII